MSSLDMLSGAIALSLDIALFDMVLFDMVSGLPMSAELATELPSRTERDRQAAEAAETAIVLRRVLVLRSVMRISSNCDVGGCIPDGMSDAGDVICGMRVTPGDRPALQVARH